MLRLYFIGCIWIIFLSLYSWVLKPFLAGIICICKLSVDQSRKENKKILDKLCYRMVYLYYICNFTTWWHKIVHRECCYFCYLVSYFFSFLIICYFFRYDLVLLVLMHFLLHQEDVRKHYWFCIIKFQVTNFLQVRKGKCEMFNEAIICCRLR